MKALVTDLLARYPGAKVRGHKDFAKKACPCFEVATYFPE
jgi:N-acetyl-anhydromuramyl-L-alanine amidase AmpD